jgi:cytochrome c-type biogenesis protein CcmH/NrfG
MPKSAQQKKEKRKRAGLKQDIIFLCSCCAAVLILTLTMANLVPVFKQERVLGAKSETPPPPSQEKLQEIIFWSDFVSKNPTYIEGWLELARLNILVGNEDGAILALDKAKEINPNSKPLEQITALLEQ